MRVAAHAHAAEIAALNDRERAFRRLNVIVQEIRVFGGDQHKDQRCRIAIIRYTHAGRAHRIAQIRHSYWYRAHLRARRKAAS